MYNKIYTEMMCETFYEQIIFDKTMDFWIWYFGKSV